MANQNAYPDNRIGKDTILTNKKNLNDDKGLKDSVTEGSMPDGIANLPTVPENADMPEDTIGLTLPPGVLPSKIPLKGQAKKPIMDK